MPTNIVMQLIKDVAILQTQVKNLMKYQYWQMGLLSMIFVAVLGAWVTR